MAFGNNLSPFFWLTETLLEALLTLEVTWLWLDTQCCLLRTNTPLPPHPPKKRKPKKTLHIMWKKISGLIQLGKVLQLWLSQAYAIYLENAMLLPQEQSPASSITILDPHLKLFFAVPAKFLVEEDPANSPHCLQSQRHFPCKRSFLLLGRSRRKLITIKLKKETSYRWILEQLYSLLSITKSL